MAKKAKKKKAKKKSVKNPKPKSISIEIKILSKVPSTKEFVLASGQKLKDLRELAFSLGDMADDVFWHHVTDTRNDFANWVEGVYKDRELAEALRNVHNKVNAQLAVLKHIVKKI